MFKIIVDNNLIEKNNNFNIYDGKLINDQRKDELISQVKD